MNKTVKISIFAALFVGILFLFPIHVQAGSWQKSGSQWTYIDDEGWKYSDGVYEIDGNYYYFDTNGIMKTGWISEKYDSWTNWYYASGSGVLAKGWKKIGNAWYWFDNTVTSDFT